MFQRQLQQTHLSAYFPQRLVLQSSNIDGEYAELRSELLSTKYYKHADRHIVIRLDNWLHKLDSTLSNLLWRKNRNSYMKLLLLMANCGMLLPPFASLPPMDDLPKLSKHDISRIMDSVSRAVKALPKASTKKTHKRVQSQLVQYQSQKTLQTDNSCSLFDQQSSYLQRFVEIASRSTYQGNHQTVKKEQVYASRKEVIAEIQIEEDGTEQGKENSDMRNCQYENTAIASSKGKFGGKLLSRQIGNTNMTTKRTMSGSQSSKFMNVAIRKDQSEDFCYSQCFDCQDGILSHNCNGSQSNVNNPQQIDKDNSCNLDIPIPKQTTYFSNNHRMVSPHIDILLHMRPAPTYPIHPHSTDQQYDFSSGISQQDNYQEDRIQDNVIGRCMKLLKQYHTVLVEDQGYRELLWRLEGNCWGNQIYIGNEDERIDVGVDENQGENIGETEENVMKDNGVNDIQSQQSLILSTSIVREPN